MRGLIFVHVGVENQLGDLEIGACSEGSPGIFFSQDGGRLWKTAAVVFQVEDFIRLSGMRMVHDFDVIMLKGDGRWRGAMNFEVWKGVFKWR